MAENKVIIGFCDKEDNILFDEKEVLLSDYDYDSLKDQLEDLLENGTISKFEEEDIKPFYEVPQEVLSELPLGNGITLYDCNYYIIILY